MQESSAASKVTSDLAFELDHRVSMFQLAESDAARSAAVVNTLLDKRLAVDVSSHPTRSAG
jgi:hypothetical protein